MRNKELTPNELWVLCVIYKLGEAEAHDVLEHSKHYEKGWKNNNVDSFLTRLFVKGYVTRERESRRYRYKPEKRLADVVSHVLDRMFADLLREDNFPLVNYLNDQRTFTGDEIKILKSIIANNEEKNGDEVTSDE